MVLLLFLVRFHFAASFSQACKTQGCCRCSSQDHMTFSFSLVQSSRSHCLFLVTGFQEPGAVASAVLQGTLPFSFSQVQFSRSHCFFLLTSFLQPGLKQKGLEEKGFTRNTTFFQGGCMGEEQKKKTQCSSHFQALVRFGQGEFHGNPRRCVAVTTTTTGTAAAAATTPAADI